jgi:hypothetical protein
VRGFFQRSKDATVGFAARAAINSKLRGIGEVTDLAIDTKNKSMRVRVELIGESEPIEVNVTEYYLRRSDRGSKITIESATASRQWVDIALQQFVVGKSFPIPPQAEPYLGFLM